jgi:hypothetical protein
MNLLAKTEIPWPAAGNAVIAPRTDRTAQRLLLLLLVGVALVYAYLAAHVSFSVDGKRYFILNDDAMISMRYAYNLVHGQGLVWNTGERIQGYTDPGWVLVMGAIHLLGLPLRSNSLVIIGINLVLHLCLIAWVFRYLRSRCGLTVAFWSALLVGLNAVLLNWATAGLETTLQTLLITGAMLPLLPMNDHDEPDVQELSRLPVLCGLAFVVRPDSLLIFGVGVLAAVAYSRQAAIADPARSSQRALTKSILIGLTLVAISLIWQKAYYGSWLPNTFYLKALGGDRKLGRSITYLRKFAFDDWQICYLVGTLFYLVQGSVRARGRSCHLGMGAVLCAWFLYVFMVHGDVLRHSRFYAPIIPVMIVCTVVALFRTYRTDRNAVSPPRPSRALALVVALALFQLVTAGLILRQSKDKLISNIVPRLKTVVCLRQLDLPADSVIGLFEQGAIPYLMPEYRFHDLLGNSDVHIAHSPAHWGPPGHNKWDYAYSLGVVRPDVIVYLYQNIGAAETQRRLDSREDMDYVPALVLDPMFRRCYALLRPPIHVAGGAEPLELWIYTRRSDL